MPVNVGVILDDLHSQTQNIWLCCIKMALKNFYASHAHYRTRLVLNIRDCKKEIVGGAAAALDLIKNEQVQAIMGPVTSMETSFVINLGKQAHVPIVSFLPQALLVLQSAALTFSNLHRMTHPN